MKTNRFAVLAVAVFAGAWLPVACRAQVNSGSNGSDGAFNPTTNTVVNMAGHLTGIYQYTSVNIPSGITVTFTPNANNTPVVWLVQSNCVIAGTVSVAGQSAGDYVGAAGGPGGGAGGSGGNYPSPGQGPGGGGGCATNWGAGGSFGSQGQSPGAWAVAGPIYGNSFLLPLLGGSGGGGGGGAYYGNGSGAGGGGGGAILIAASGSIQLNGGISAYGGFGSYYVGACGSGGAVRLVTANFSGGGSIDARGSSGSDAHGGNGRIRIDAYQNTFGGQLLGVVSQGFQPIILPTPGAGAQLTISSIAGVAVSTSPTGVLSIPDAVLSAQQNNPIPIVVSCANLPLHSLVTVSVRPSTGSSVSTTAYNDLGTLASSSATVLISIPRGGGLVYATASISN